MHEPARSMHNVDYTELAPGHGVMTHEGSPELSPSTPQCQIGRHSMLDSRVMGPRVSGRPKRIRKSGLIKCAYEPCRCAKVKCDGGRPQCGKCRRANNTCVYATSEASQTRQQAKKEHGEFMRQQLEKCEELIELLHGQANSQAVESLLARPDFKLRPKERRLREQEPVSSFSEFSSPVSPLSFSTPDEERPDTWSAGPWDPLLMQIDATRNLSTGKEAAEEYLPHQQPSALTPSFCVLGLESSSLPLHTPEESMMSNLYLSFRDASRSIIQDGTPAPILLGNLDSVEATLLFRERNPQDALNVDNWACELLTGLRNNYDFHFLLAWASLLARFMRWVILPTEGTYSRLPQMMRPLPSQRSIPHNPAIDLCPHPVFRGILMRSYRNWLFPLSSEDLSVWANPRENAVVCDSTTGSMHLTSAFETHVHNPANWKLGDVVRQAFPEAEDLGIEFHSWLSSDS